MSLVGYMLHYISNMPDLRQNISGSYIISFHHRHPTLPYSLSPSDSSVPISPPSSDDSCPALIPRIYRAGCSQHFMDRRIPRFFSASRHNYMKVQVAMYCATMFWRRAIYNPISSSTTIASATPMCGYTHVSFCWRLGPITTIHHAAWWWNPEGIYTTGGSEPTSRTKT